MDIKQQASLLAAAMAVKSCDEKDIEAIVSKFLEQLPLVEKELQQQNAVKKPRGSIGWVR